MYEFSSSHCCDFFSFPRDKWLPSPCKENKQGVHSLLGFSDLMLGVPTAKSAWKHPGSLVLGVSVCLGLTCGLPVFWSTNMLCSGARAGVSKPCYPQRTQLIPPVTGLQSGRGLLSQYLFFLLFLRLEMEKVISGPGNRVQMGQSKNRKSSLGILGFGEVTHPTPAMARSSTVLRIIAHT